MEMDVDRRAPWPDLAEAVTASALGSVERCTPAAAGAGRQAAAKRSTASTDKAWTLWCRAIVATYELRPPIPCLTKR